MRLGYCRTFLVFSISLLVSIGTAGAIEIEVDNYILTIGDQSGHFAVEYQRDGRRLPLFFTENPRTSSVSMRYGDAVIRFTDDKDFVVSVQEFQDSIITQYSIENLRHQQRFSFIEGPNGSIAGIAVDLSLVNIDTPQAQAELRMILDTTLGEQRPGHFSTSRNPSITREYQFSPNSSESWILSYNGDYGLLLTLAGSGATAPRTALSANWKRLSEASWDYETQENRNFNLLPFSINDSALAMYYGPEVLGPQDEIRYRLYVSFIDDPSEIPSVQLALANGTARVIDGEAQRAVEIAIVEDTIEEDEPEASSGLSPDEIRIIAPYLQEIDTLNALIDQIDALLRSRSTLSRSEVQALESILETVQNNIPD